MTHKVLIDVPPIHPDALALFDREPDVEIIRYDRDKDGPLAEKVRDVDGIMVGLAVFDESVIEKAPKLKILAKHGVGYDNIDVPAATKRNIPVAVTPYANNLSVAEFTITFMLAMTKLLLP